MNNVHFIQDHKFKNDYVQVRFITKLDQESIAKRMLLTLLMNELCEKFYTKQLVSNELDRLYGASYRCSSSIIGNAQLFIFKTKAIRSSFIHHEMDLLEEQFKLLHAFLMNPRVVDNAFLQEHVKEAKMNYKNSVQRSQDDPSTYSMHEAMKIAGKGQPLGAGIHDDLQAVDAITPQDLYDAYKQLVNEMHCDVMVLGNSSQERVEELVRTYLPFTHKGIDFSVNYEMQYRDIDDVVEEKELSQSYITSVYTTHTKNDEADYYALRVANVVFGQIPGSLLFQEIREKRSLCYSIYSALNPYDGALMISTGVDNANIEKTHALIEKQLERMQTHAFDEQLVEVAKRMIVNSIIASADDPDSIFALQYRNVLFNDPHDINQVIEEINKVQISDIVTVMNKVKRVASFTLKGNK